MADENENLIELRILEIDLFALGIPSWS